MRSHRPLHASGRRRSRDDGTARFERFVADSGDRLFRLAVVLSSDVGAGEDLYQDTMQRVATNWASIENPEAWARRVMHNLVVDRYRARRARPLEVPEPERGSPADPRSTESMEAAEVRPVLFRALADLSDSQRLVVAMRFLEDRSEAEVAELLGLPVGTVKSTTSRAVARLRRHPALTQLFDAEEEAS